MINLHTKYPNSTYIFISTWSTEPCRNFLSASLLSYLPITHEQSDVVPILFQYDCRFPTYKNFFWNLSELYSTTRLNFLKAPRWAPICDVAFFSTFPIQLDSRAQFRFPTLVLAQKKIILYSTQKELTEKRNRMT